MQNPRDRLFPYHLNADAVEKEYRIWKCLEEQLSEENKEKWKKARLLEEERMRFWDTLTSQKTKKSSNPHSSPRKKNPKPENGKEPREATERRDRVLMRQIFVGRTDEQRKWEQKREESIKNGPRKNNVGREDCALPNEGKKNAFKDQEIELRQLEQKEVEEPPVRNERRDRKETKERAEEREKQPKTRSQKWELNTEKRDNENRQWAKKEEQLREKAVNQRKSMISQKRKEQEDWERKRDRKLFHFS